MLTASHLRKEFGSKIAVEDLTLSLNPGELFGFLGPNGAGKSTSMRMLVGLLTPSRGHVKVGDYDLHKQPNDAKLLLGFVPDQPILYEKLTGWEFLQFMTELYGVQDLRSAFQKAETWLAQFELTDNVHARISTYSHGMKQKISLIGQLIHNPKVLLLDEPTVGLDPKGAKTLREVLRSLCAEGTTVLISTHLLQTAELMCDRVGIMDKGRMVATGSLKDLQSTYDTNEGLEDIFFHLTELAEGATVS